MAINHTLRRAAVLGGGQTGEMSPVPDGRRRSLVSVVRRGLLGALVVVATACGGSDLASTSDSTQSKESSDELNVVDEMFVEMMLPHHEQAIAMSAMALDPMVGARSDVVELARRITTVQEAEIAVLNDLASTMQGMGGDHSHMMKGMLSEEELDELATLRGAEFDRRWLEAMIAHHEGAIEMADDVLRDGSNGRVRDLATDVVDTQRDEIDLMQTLLG